jgi:hypothetical protein
VPDNGVTRTWAFMVCAAPGAVVPRCASETFTGLGSIANGDLGLASGRTMVGTAAPWGLCTCQAAVSAREVARPTLPCTIPTACPELHSSTVAP